MGVLPGKKGLASKPFMTDKKERKDYFCFLGGSSNVEGGRGAI